MPSQLSPLSVDDRRALAPWAHACLSRVIHLFWSALPDDDRPVEALDGLAAFAAGHSVDWSTLAADCRAAAEEAGNAKEAAAEATALACAEGISLIADDSAAQRVAPAALTALSIADPGSVASEDAWQRRSVPNRLKAFVYGGTLVRTIDVREIELASVRQLGT